MNARQCKACGELIRFIKTAGGKSIPCNFNEVYYKQTRHSRERVVTPNGEVLAAEIVQNYAEAEGLGYIPHWSTCTNPDAFRRGR